MAYPLSRVDLVHLVTSHFSLGELKEVTFRDKTGNRWHAFCGDFVKRNPQPQVPLPNMPDVLALVQALRCEKVLHVQTRLHLPDARSSAPFSRIYFGDEFCQNLIPSRADLEGIISWCQRNGKSLTLLTPFCTEPGLQKLIPLIKRAAALPPALNVEIVVNDLGVLRRIQHMAPSMPLSLGRLLSRQRRDPRIADFWKLLPRRARTYFCESNVGIKEYREFLYTNNLRRLELDNPLQGIPRDLKGCGLKLSLHYPYAYVTTTRLCLAARCESLAERSMMRIAPCNRECQRYLFQLNHPTQRMLVMKGNTQYCVNLMLPQDLDRGGIDRVVIGCLTW